MARCFWNYKDYAQSLSHYNMVDKHFSDIIDDQF